MFDPAFRRRLTLSLLALPILTHSLSAAEPPVPAKFEEARGLIAQYCGKCHGEKVSKGGLNLAAFGDEKAILKQPQGLARGRRAAGVRRNAPRRIAQTDAEQNRRLRDWIGTTLDAADARDRAKPNPGRSIVRRLTRSEYNRTIRDLLGVQLDASGAVGMPDETVGGGFDNLSTALNLSEGLMEKYFAAADLMIDHLYETARPRGEKPKLGAAPNPFDGVVFIVPGIRATPKLAARCIVGQLMRRAYRRPVAEREIDRMLGLFDAQAMEKSGFTAALRPILKAVIVSPNFLLRIERDRATDAESPYRIDDHELATRLSYFIWSSMPDAELFARADAGDLHEPAVLDRQVRRMLADPKSRALADDFAAQWLHLRDLPDARPSTEFFPTFTPQMRLAMHAEATAFFNNLRTADKPITDLLDADYTFVNEELARHYGIKGISGQEMRLVKLPDLSRGGLLGMGAVLSVTSHTSRTSPTLRGKYVLEVILGTPPRHHRRMSARSTRPKREARRKPSALSWRCTPRPHPARDATPRSIRSASGWRASTPSADSDPPAQTSMPPASCRPAKHSPARKNSAAC